MSLRVLIELIGDLRIYKSQSELDGRHETIRIHRILTGLQGKQGKSRRRRPFLRRAEGGGAGRPRRKNGGDFPSPPFAPVKPIAEVTDTPCLFEFS
jgi:hypothetical protein